MAEPRFRVEGDPPKWLLYPCQDPDRGDGEMCRLALRPHQKNGNGASWSWDGNLEAPTINPSVNCSCGWHGWIRAGNMERA